MVKELLGQARSSYTVGKRLIHFRMLKRQTCVVRYVHFEQNLVQDDTTWLAFEEATRSHASTLERPNPPAPKLKHFSNLHDALRTHMHSKHRLGNANTDTGKEKKNYAGSENRILILLPKPTSYSP
eukprot:1137302-Pelagomonas_calceolata.AAC.3